MKPNKKNIYIGIALSSIFALIYICFINDISFPWRDELCFTDVPANFSQNGEMLSYVWRYCAPPLHGILLTCWLYLFGVSHLSACSFTVAIGLVTSVLLLRIMIRREIITNPIITLIYVVLFWGSYTFSGLLTNGRIDLLVMLFTILFVNEIIPYKGQFYSQSRWPSVVYAFLVMSTYIYTVPITCFFSLFILFVIKDKYYRKELLIRYIWVIIALIFSFILTCLFLASQHSLFRYLNAFISFNATINKGADTPSLSNRIVDAYSIDIYALLLLVVSYIIHVYNNGIKGLKENWFPFLFVTCIPLLMVFAGRYRVYYSCVFYIPVLVLFIWNLSQYKSKMVLGAFLFFALLSSISTPLLKMDYYKRNKEEMRRVSLFVDSCNMYLKKGENVVFNNSKFYYLLLDQDVVLWQKYKGLQEIDSPEEKFMTFINKKIASPEKRKKVLDIFRQLEAPDPYIPSDGLIITEGKEGVNRVKTYTKSHSISIEEVYSAYGFTLFKFEKKL